MFKPLKLFKISSLSKATALLLGLALSTTLLLEATLWPGKALAEELTWPGSPVRPDPVDPAWQSLYPHSLNGNRVTINGGPALYRVYGGYNNGPENVTHNQVTVNNGADITWSVSGGAVFNGGGSANYNRVIINGGTIDNDVIGGWVNNGGGSANYNQVIINDGNIGVDVNAGYVNNGGGSANYNQVIINGGNIRRDVFCGYVLNGGGDATYNIVTLSGRPVFAASSRIGGGDPGGGGDKFTGNTLNLWNYQGTSKVAEVENFEFYNFTAAADLGAGYNPLKTGDLNLDGPAGAKSKISGVNIMGGGAIVASGSKITLIEVDNAWTGNFDNIDTTTQGKKGVSLLYDFYVENDGSDNLIATADFKGLNPQTKAFNEGKLAGFVSAIQGGDLVTGPGFGNAVAATRAAEGKPDSGPVAFGAAAFGHNRYNSGSHIDVNGFNMLAGVAWGQQLVPARLTTGVFLEAGHGDYNTHNSFASAASIKGEGDSEYFGGGVLARLDWNCGLYTEMSGRIGQVSSDFRSSDLRDGMGNRAHYDSDSAYYGLHAGLGYIWEITDEASLDIYTKYIWTHQNSDSVNVLGDPVHFDSADSHRWKSGARFSYALTSNVAPYIGAAYDHEFDAEAKGTAYGLAMDSPDLKGGTGMLELGVTANTFPDAGLSLDLGLQGYTGQREGVTGSLQLKYEF